MYIVTQRYEECCVDRTDVRGVFTDLAAAETLCSQLVSEREEKNTDYHYFQILEMTNGVTYYTQTYDGIVPTVLRDTREE